MFGCIIKQYMAGGFVEIETIREQADEKLEDLYTFEKKTAKSFNKLLDELSELEDYA